MNSPLPPIPPGCPYFEEEVFGKPPPGWPDRTGEHIRWIFNLPRLGEMGREMKKSRIFLEWDTPIQKYNMIEIDRLRPIIASVAETAWRKALERAPDLWGPKDYEKAKNAIESWREWGESNEPR